MCCAPPPPLALPPRPRIPFARAPCPPTPPPPLPHHPRPRAPRRYEELQALHSQLTSLLAAGEASGGGLCAAQAAAELAGVPAAGSAALHAQQAALAEARCRERFERKALEEFVRQSLQEEIPPPPVVLASDRLGEGEGDGRGADGLALFRDAAELRGGDGGVAELQARIHILSNARRSHAAAWEEMVRATSARVESLRSLKAQLNEPLADDGAGGGLGAGGAPSAACADGAACGGFVTPRNAPVALCAVAGADEPTPARPGGSIRRQPSGKLRQQVRPGCGVGGTSTAPYQPPPAPTSPLSASMRPQ